MGHLLPPPRPLGQTMIDLGRILRYAIDQGASDIHLKVPAPPALRLHGSLERIPKAPPLRSEDTERFLKEMLAKYPEKLEARTSHMHVKASVASASTPSVSAAPSRSSCVPCRSRFRSCPS